jgi:hypothetical protein
LDYRKKRRFCELLLGRLEERADPAAQIRSDWPWSRRDLCFGERREKQEVEHRNNGYDDKKLDERERCSLDRGDLPSFIATPASCQAAGLLVPVERPQSLQLHWLDVSIVKGDIECAGEFGDGWVVGEHSRRKRRRKDAFGETEPFDCPEALLDPDSIEAAICAGGDDKLVRVQTRHIAPLNPIAAFLKKAGTCAGGRYEELIALPGKFEVTHRGTTALGHR